MSDTNRTAVNFGRHPSGQVPRNFPISDAQKPPLLHAMRTTGQPNFAFTPEVVESAEIRADRQRAKPKSVGGEAGGTVGIELSPRSFDELIESTLFGSWQNTFRATGTAVTVTGDLEVTVTTGGGADNGDFPEGLVVFLAWDDGTNKYEEAYEITGRAYADPVITLTLAHVGPSASAPALGALGTDTNTVLSVTGVMAQAADEITITAVNAAVGEATLAFTGDAAAALDDLYGITGARTPAVPGVWIKLNGFANPENNIWCRIKTVTASEWTLENAGGMVVEDPGPDDVALFLGDYVRNGVEPVVDHSFLVERVYEDHADPLHEVHVGSVINQMTLTLDPKAIVVGQIEFFGLNSLADGVSTYDSNGDGTIYSGVAPTVVPAPEDDVFNTSDNIGRVAVGPQSIISSDGLNVPTQITLTIANNARRRPGIGFRGAVSIGVGEFAATGQFNTYFDNKTELDAVIANTTKAFDMAIQDLNTGRTMVFDAPSTAYTGGAVENTAKNQDTTLPIPFGAFKDPTLGYTFQVQRCAFAG